MWQSWYAYQVGTKADRVGTRTKSVLGVLELVPDRTELVRVPSRYPMCQSWYAYQVGTKADRVGTRTKSVLDVSELVPGRTELVRVPDWY